MIKAQNQMGWGCSGSVINFRVRVVFYEYRNIIKEFFEFSRDGLQGFLHQFFKLVSLHISRE
jgi:hypothetical protein